MKLHGANTAVILNNGIHSVQSRNRELGEGKDMEGFYAFVQVRRIVHGISFHSYFNVGKWCVEYLFHTFHTERTLQLITCFQPPFLSFYTHNVIIPSRGQSRAGTLLAIETTLRKEFSVPATSIIRVTGEWCGPGIQTRVGLNELPAKIWVIFHISVYADRAKQDSKGERSSKSLDLYHPSVKSIRNDEQRIFVSTNFKTFEMTVDFDNQADAMAKIEELTKQVGR